MKFTALDSLPKKQAFLHFEATRTDANNVQVDYELVIPLDKVDCRGTFDHRGRAKRPKSHRTIWLDKENNRRIPLGRTLIGTQKQNYPFYPMFPDEIELPFRDGAHAGWDNEKLGNLPIIYTRGSEHWTLIPSAKTATP